MGWYATQSADGKAAGRAMALVLLAGLGAACSSDKPMEPDPEALTITVVQGDQVAATSQAAPKPLIVRVTETASGDPVEGATVTWTVVQGAGAQTSPGMTATDSLGEAATTLTLGATAGEYLVRAGTPDADADVTISVRAFSMAPVLTSLTPTAATSDQTVTITGTGFSDRAEDNAVFYGPFRADVQSATTTTLVTTVPACMVTADTDVTVRLGPLVSNALTASITADAVTPVSLAVGESRRLSTTGDLECVALPGDGGEEYLLISHNAGTSALGSLNFRLAGHVADPLTTLRTDLFARPAFGIATDVQPPQQAFERRIRALERLVGPTAAAAATGRPNPGPSAYLQPSLGAMDDFQVFDGDDFTSVTAELVFSSDHALIFEDVNAPAGGFSTADYEAFANEFDDPIYDRDVEVFGAASDIDGNGRVIILFTPVVNQLTPPGSDGFVAGFFFGLDLLNLANSNQAEIFYSVVPDPSGDFGDPRSRERILEVVPPVLSHEFQHMIGFNQRVLIRNGSLEKLWLSEALAHTAESVVAEVFASRGDPDRALDFEISNLARARRYLQEPASTRLVADVGDGTLAERGAGWLFMQYLRGHFGADAVLRSLTQTNASGVTNVTSVTGDPWTRLLTGWLVANYADGAPELPSGPVDVRDTYPNLDLRAEFQGLGLSYPLAPQQIGFVDIAQSFALPASSGRYLIVDAGAGAPELRLRLAGEDGAPFPTGSSPGLSVLRLR